MADIYEYTVNNMPQVWTAEVSKAGDEHVAKTTSFGRTFECKGGSADEALAALKAELEEIGWFFTDDFAQAKGAAAAS